MQGEIPLPGEPYRDHSGLAILPEAEANQYAPQEIPFTGRDWDQRIPADFDLSHRLGIRTMNIWTRWLPKPPYTPDAPCIDLVKKYKMGAIFSAESGLIERHGENWEQFDDTALRQGIRNLLTTFGKDIPARYIDLGNEPPVLRNVSGLTWRRTSRSTRRPRQPIRK